MGSFAEDLSSLFPLLVTSNDNDQGTFDSATIDANEELTIDLTAEGANTVRGKVVVSNSYDVELRYLDAPGGTPLFDNAENIIQGQSGGAVTTFSKDAYSSYLRVVIRESSGAQGTVDASVSV